MCRSSATCYSVARLAGNAPVSHVAHCVPQLRHPERESRDPEEVIFKLRDGIPRLRLGMTR
jgi:hypothetical protein